MKLSFALFQLYLFLTLAVPAFAQFDMQAQASARSYPEAGIFSLSSGWSKILWEKETTSENLNWKYGYVRPWAQIQSIGITHRALAEIEFFPVSIFGLGVGKGTSIRSSDKNSALDCSSIECDGQINRNYLKLISILGAGRFGWVGQVRFESILRSSNEPFLDETTNLIGAREGESARTIGSGIFYKLSSSYQLGILWAEQQFMRSQNSSETLSLLGQMKHQDWKYSLAIGQFRSTHQDAGATVAVQATWTFAESPSLLR